MIMNGPGKRKCKDGIKVVRIPIHLHEFITKAGTKLGLNNYEVIERMALNYAPLFCPELAKILSKGK
jgi:hypothetical protein